MSGAFFQARGISPNVNVDVVFVWCRNKGPDDYMLLGSAHVVRANGRELPKGISPGQFNVTFLLPPGLSPANIVVTDDMSGKAFLADVTITPCSGLASLRAGAMISPAVSAVRANSAAASSPSAPHDRNATADHPESDL